MSILKLLVCGHVDDGKSTLMGRLLLDSHSLMLDQIEDLKNSTRSRGQDGLNLAYVSDGLKSERDQGITIDTAYRFFSTARRRFILIDAPGHKEYTKNMLSGATQANAGLLILDSSRQIEEQSYRHSFLLAFAGVKNLVVCINKMDESLYSEARFENFKNNFKKYLESLSFESIYFIPTSGLYGDNIVQASTQMPWYQGPCLLNYLEELKISLPFAEAATFSIQFLREHGGRKWVFGQDKNLALNRGLELCNSRTGQIHQVEDLHYFQGSLSGPYALGLSDANYLKRGDELSLPPIKTSDHAEGTLFWLSQNVGSVKKKYLLKTGTREVEVRFDSLTQEPLADAFQKPSLQLILNQVLQAKIRLSEALPYWSRALLIDPQTKESVAAFQFNDKSLIAPAHQLAR